MSYSNFNNPDFIKDLDKIVNDIFLLRIKIPVEKQINTSNKEFIKRVDGKLLDLQNFINKEKIRNLKI